MRKILYIMASVALLFATGCDDDKGNNNNNPWGYAPNSCFASGATSQFRWANGQCIDVRNNQPSNPINCQQSNFGNSFDPSCNTYGGFNNGIPGGGFGFGGGFGNFGDRCSQVYGPGWITSRGVFGELVCVNSGSWNYISGFYGSAPVNFGGYYQTCIPGGSFNCNCRSFGGTLGWVAGGASVGYCF